MSKPLAQRTLPLFLAALAAHWLVGPAYAANEDEPGTLVSVASSPLAVSLWPEKAAQGYKITYYSSDAFGQPALSTGAIYLPAGNAPAGGWPIISWAHGTSGMADNCAPSDVGPAEPERDLPYLGKWLAAGYAIVATDYVGLGTPGLHAYLEGQSSAHAIVDMVKAARHFGADRASGGNDNLFANKWVAVGQSQGGGAAIYTARYATEFGGPELDYRGAVGTGTPAFIEILGALQGPLLSTGAATTAYMSYILNAIREVHPEVDWDSVLTETGKTWLKKAEAECILPLMDDLSAQGVTGDQFFNQPVFTLPGAYAALQAYLGMPTDGFDKPFFLGQGSNDADVPYAVTGVPYSTLLKLNHQPVTFKTYWGLDHSQTLVESSKDTIPFVNKLMSNSP